jgi:Calcineurin-like phosphoesterase
MTFKKSHIFPSLVLALAAAQCLSVEAVAHSKPPKHPKKNDPITLAVIGDTPYGAAQAEAFPTLVSAINADPDVSHVVHVGDIKNGSTRCDDSYFTQVFEYFGTFEDSLIYTPGDNEWTDCHRSNNGKYNPLERLSAIRKLFFATPTRALGQTPLRLESQGERKSYRDLPENQRFEAAKTVFATLHVVGSLNNLAPWFGDDTTDEFVDSPEERLAEVKRRTQATLDWIDETFRGGCGHSTRAVVFFMQADTWPGGEGDGYSEILQKIATHAVKFKKPVYVIQGDSHVYKVDAPLATGDAVHGIDFPVPNLTRIVVQGSTIGEWLKVTVDPNSPTVLSWERQTVPVSP